MYPPPAPSLSYALAEILAPQNVCQQSPTVRLARLFSWLLLYMLSHDHVMCDTPFRMDAVRRQQKLRNQSRETEPVKCTKSEMSTFNLFAQSSLFSSLIKHISAMVSPGEDEVFLCCYLHILVL